MYHSSVFAWFDLFAVIIHFYLRHSQRILSLIGIFLSASLMTQFPQGEYHIFSNPIINILATSPSNRPLLLTTTLIICSSFRTKSTFFCVVREARTALWFLQVSLALSYESLVVMNFRQELPTRCQLSPHTFSAAERVDLNTSDMQYASWLYIHWKNWPPSVYICQKQYRYYNKIQNFLKSSCLHLVDMQSFKHVRQCLIG